MHELLMRIRSDEHSMGRKLLDEELNDTITLYLQEAAERLKRVKKWQRTSTDDEIDRALGLTKVCDKCGQEMK